MSSQKLSEDTNEVRQNMFQGYTLVWTISLLLLFSIGIVYYNRYRLLIKYRNIVNDLKKNQNYQNYSDEFYDQLVYRALRQDNIYDGTVLNRRKYKKFRPLVPNRIVKQGLTQLRNPIWNLDQFYKIETENMDNYIKSASNPTWQGAAASLDENISQDLSITNERQLQRDYGPMYRQLFNERYQKLKRQGKIARSSK